MFNSLGRGTTPPGCSHRAPMWTFLCASAETHTTCRSTLSRRVASLHDVKFCMDLVIHDDVWSFLRPQDVAYIWEVPVVRRSVASACYISNQDRIYSYFIRYCSMFYASTGRGNVLFMQKAHFGDVFQLIYPWVTRKRGTPWAVAPPILKLENIDVIYRFSAKHR